MDPLVSIIVPVYNVKPYLNRCVDSLLGQSYQNMELLLAAVRGERSGTDIFRLGAAAGGRRLHRWQRDPL